MKLKYKQVVENALKIIEHEIKLEKQADYIKDKIYYMLEETQIGIHDLEHFDRYYFKLIMGMRISSYIKQEQMKYAVLEYEKAGKKRINKKRTYKNVSNFIAKYGVRKGKNKMKKYMVTSMENLECEDLYWISYKNTNDEMLLVEAGSKEEAVRKYLYTQYEFETKGIIEEEIFRQFWIDVANGDWEYMEGLSRENDLIKLAERVYGQYMENDDDKPEESILKYDTEAISAEFFTLLNKQDRKITYYYCNRNNVFCVELETLAHLKKRKRKNKRNIINDITENDIIVLNLISEMIRKEDKKSYCIDGDILAEQGFDKHKIQELLEYVCSLELHCNINSANERGAFVFYSLFSHRTYTIGKTNDVLSVDIYPEVILRKLAKAGYNFEDGRNAIAERVMDECRQAS